MGKKNHEIRFRTDRELFEITDRLHKHFSEDLKKASFYRSVFLLGINNLKLQLTKQNKAEVLASFFRK